MRQCENSLRVPSALKMSFEGLKRRQGSCWVEWKRKIHTCFFLTQGSLICPLGKSKIFFTCLPPPKYLTACKHPCKRPTYTKYMGKFHYENQSQRTQNKCAHAHFPVKWDKTQILHAKESVRLETSNICPKLPGACVKWTKYKPNP